MKRDEWLESVAVKRLALFANCANSRCRCDGFRPWIDGLPTNFEKQYGIFYVSSMNKLEVKMPFSLISSTMTAISSSNDVDHVTTNSVGSLTLYL